MKEKVLNPYPVISNLTLIHLKYLLSNIYKTPLPTSLMIFLSPILTEPILPNRNLGKTAPPVKRTSISPTTLTPTTLR